MARTTTGIYSEAEGVRQHENADTSRGAGTLLSSLMYILLYSPYLKPYLMAVAQVRT